MAPRSKTAKDEEETKDEVEMSIEEDDGDQNLRVVRIGSDHVIETALPTFGFDRWIDLHSHEKRRRAPLVAGLCAYSRQIAGGGGSGERRSQIYAVSICLGGTHVFLYTFGASSFECSGADRALRDLVADGRITFVGVGIKKAAAELGESMGVHVKRPAEVRDLAAEAFGREKVGQWKRKAWKSLVEEWIGLERTAELALGGIRVPAKPERVRETVWTGDRRCPIRIQKEEEVLMFATRDAFLCFEIGFRCIKKLGRPT